MQPAYMHPNIIYVEVISSISDKGYITPRSLLFEKEFPIDEVLEAETCSDKERDELFPPPPQEECLVYKYKVRIKGREKTLYFERWPESGPMGVGRWFVHQPHNHTSLSSTG